MQAAVRIAILAALVGTSFAQAAELAIRIDNVESNDGQIMVALYDRAGYMKQPLRTAVVEAVAGATMVQFKDLAPHRNRMGMPVEMSTFSNDAQGFMGPPPYEAARLALPDTGRAVTVNLR